MQKKLMLILLFAVFALPPALSWFLFNYTEAGRRAEGVQHGTLVTPPRPLPDWDLLDPLADSDTGQRLRGKWSLIYLLRSACQASCNENLHRMRQIRLATGRYAPRVQRVVLVASGAKDALSRAQLTDYTGQLLLFPGAISDGRLSGLFSLGVGDRPFEAQRLYLVDPMGNLMMSYAADSEPVGIIRDLKRLLRYSGTG